MFGDALKEVLGCVLDCEQSLSFPRVARVAICEGEREPREARARGKRKKKKTAVVF